MLMAKQEPLMLNNNHSEKKQTGFTLIELLIATSIFSVIMLVVTTGIVRIGQSYYKGIIQSRTQEVTRSVGEDISRTIQLSNGIVTKNNIDITCVGDVRYVYKLNKQVPASEGLVSYRVKPTDDCYDLTQGTDKKELLGQNMRLLKFDVSVPPDDLSGRTWKIDIRVAYGEDDLLSSYNDDSTPNGWDGVDPNMSAVQDATCRSGIAGNSFCATSKLDILVKRRLN